MSRSNVDLRRSVKDFYAVSICEAAAGRRPALRFCPTGAALFSPMLTKAFWQWRFPTPAFLNLPVEFADVTTVPPRLHRHWDFDGEFLHAPHCRTIHATPAKFLDAVRQSSGGRFQFVCPVMLSQSRRNHGILAPTEQNHSAQRWSEATTLGGEHKLDEP